MRGRPTPAGRPYPSAKNVAALQVIRTTLEKVGYDEASCCHSLGISDMSRLSAWTLPSLRTLGRGADSTLGMLVSLFALNSPMQAVDAARLLPAEFKEALVTARLVVQQEDLVFPRVSIFPCRGLYVVTDLTEDRAMEDQVFWLSTETYWLAEGISNLTGDGRAADLGFGSGIHALLLRRNGFDLHAVDLNRRAQHFAEFNRRLNKVSRIAWHVNHLYDGLGRAGPFELIVSHPPFSPEDEGEPGNNYWAGGLRGDAVLSEIVQGLPLFLATDGLAVICTLLTYQRAETFEDKLRDWLGPKRRLFDVTVEREVSDYGTQLRDRTDAEGRRRYAHWRTLEIERAERARIFFRRPAVSGGKVNVQNIS